MQRKIFKTGFISGYAAFTAAFLFVIFQTLQLFKLLQFPYDEILIYGSSLLIVIPFMLEVLALHYSVEQDQKFWTHAALIFTIIYAVFVTANYVVQLTSVIPHKLQKGSGNIDILIQTPHSLFWDFDAIGYISMGFATFFASYPFNSSGFQRWVKRILLINGLINPLIAIVYFYPVYSEKLLMLGITWAITAPASMLLLAVQFHKAYEQNKSTITA